MSWGFILIIVVAVAAVFLAVAGNRAGTSSRNAAAHRVAWVAARVIAWAWAFLAGLGGLILLIHEGPLPITNGWFAMFSGIAACPLSGTLLKRYSGANITLSVQLLVAMAIFIAGRIAVVVVLHRPFLPECSGQCW